MTPAENVCLRMNTDENMLGETNSWFTYPGDVDENGNDKEDVSNDTLMDQRVRLAIGILCECGENTVAPDGDDDDSNDVSSVDDISKTGCCLAAVQRMEPMLSRLELDQGKYIVVLWLCHYTSCNYRRNYFYDLIHNLCQYTRL